MVNLSTLNIDPAVLYRIPKNSALRLSVLPISEQNGIVIVAVPEIFPEQLLTDVRFILGTKNIKPISVSRDNITAAIYHFYDPKAEPK